MKNRIIMFWGIVAILIVSICVLFSKPTSLGLDLVGASRLELQAQKTETIAEIKPEMMDSLIFAIKSNNKGVYLSGGTSTWQTLK